MVINQNQHEPNNEESRSKKEKVLRRRSFLKVSFICGQTNRARIRMYSCKL